MKWYRDIRQAVDYIYHNGYADGSDCHLRMFAWLYVLQPHWYRKLKCWLFGHQWVDNDPGDCEVGPQPDLSCTRC